MYQIQRSVNPGVSASSSTGTATMTMRVTDVISDGIVLPIAWNMLELTKMTPDATKLKATMCRYSSPTAIDCRVGGEHAHHGIAAEPHGDGEDQHGRRGDRRAGRERLADARRLPRAEVLAGHRAHGEAERDDRQEAGLEDPHADAEARLRRGAERPR